MPARAHICVENEQFLEFGIAMEQFGIDRRDDVIAARGHDFETVIEGRDQIHMGFIRDPLRADKTTHGRRSERPSQSGELARTLLAYHASTT